ncbi:MAG: PAS domain S-box protein [Methanolinea sp.]
MFPLLLVALSSVLVFAFTILSLSLGFTVIFQNAYYIPIILSCYYYQRRGLVFSFALSMLYFASLLSFYPTLEIFYQGLIRVLFFLLIAAIVTFLSERITREKARYQGIFYNSESGILVWEKPGGSIVEANPEASRILGYPLGELSRMGIPDVFPDPGITDAILSGKGEMIHHRETEVRHADGTTRIVSLSAGSIDARSGMVTFQDISEKKRAEEAISLANRKLNLLNSITRHDILNTLTALLGYLELASETATGRETEGYIDSATRAALMIRRQVEFTRDYQDVGVRSPGWFSLHDLIGKQRAHAEQKGVRVEANLPDIQVYADPLIEKVFYNLVENSLRHGGNVTRIWFSAERVGNDLVVRCCDDGRGVSEDKKTAIFNREYYQHSGFGLFLSREILAITGIRIRETGTPGKGAVFELVIPQGSYRVPEK